MIVHLTFTFHRTEWLSHARDIQSKFTNNSQIAAAFGNMSEQANKLGIGASDVFIASYEKHQVNLTGDYFFVIPSYTE